jgi:hypothetical protein
MRSRPSFIGSVVAISVAVYALAFALPEAAAKNPQMEQKVAEIKQASAANKQALARYTWQEQQVISLKGEVKKTVSYQVSVGLDGQQQKVELGSSAAPAPRATQAAHRRQEKRRVSGLRAAGRRAGKAIYTT